MPKSPKRPRDPAQLAKLIVDLATGDAQDAPEKDATLPSRLGGLKGGTARAASLSADERREIARRAAQARWTNKKPDDD